MNSDRPDCETEFSGGSVTRSLLVSVARLARLRKKRLFGPDLPSAPKGAADFALLTAWLEAALFQSRGEFSPFRSRVLSKQARIRSLSADCSAVSGADGRVSVGPRHGRGWGFSARTAKYCPFSPFANSASARVINNWRPFSRAANQTSERKQR